MSDRGIKKWLPFQGINEQSQSIREIKKRKNMLPQPILSPDQEERINDVITHYAHEVITIIYYDMGTIRQWQGRCKIDVIQQKIISSTGVIPFADIVDILR